MDTRKRMFKKKGAAFCDNLTRKQRADERCNERRDLRRQTFFMNRNIEVEAEVKKEVSAEEIKRVKLEIFKKQRNRGPLVRRVHPPFKCGTVKHDDSKLYQVASPAEKDFQEKKPLAPPGFMFKAPNGVVPLPFVPAQRSQAVLRGYVFCEKENRMLPPSSAVKHSGKKTPQVPNKFLTDPRHTRTQNSQIKVKVEKKVTPFKHPHHTETQNSQIKMMVKKKETPREADKAEEESEPRRTRAAVKKLLNKFNDATTLEPVHEPHRTRGSVRTAVLCDIQPEESPVLADVLDSGSRPSLLPIQYEPRQLRSSRMHGDLICFDSPVSK